MNIKKTLLEPTILTKIQLLRVILIFAAIGSIISLLSSTVGVVVAILGLSLLAIQVYNELIGKEERGINIELPKEEK